MKRLAVSAVALLLLGAGCVVGGNESPAVPEGTPRDAAETSPTTSLEILPPSDGVVPDAGDAQAEPGDTEPPVEPVASDLPVKQVDMRSGNFFFEPSSIAVETGQEVEILFTENSGFHTFVIDEIGFKAAVTEGGTIRFTAPQEGGTYSFYCDVGNHRAFGMEGTLHVKEL